MTLTALRVRGPFHGPSGYDHHVREFVRELHRQGIAVELVDFPAWSAIRLPSEHQDPWFDSINRPVGARVALHFTMPHQVAPFPDSLNVNYTMFEGTRIPWSWVMHSRNHDLVILPTESSRRAWVDSGVPDEHIRLCPLGVDPGLFATPADPLPLRTWHGVPVSHFRARFLNVSELDPRKNTLGLLRTWLRATSAEDDCVLMLKLLSTDPKRLAMLQRDLERLQRKEGKTFDRAAPICIIDAMLSDAKMRRLYASATHYVSLSFGEGWDQPMMEAAASELRLIAPDHSAYPTYLDATIARLIPTHEAPAALPPGDQLAAYFLAASWWQPDEDEAARAIRDAMEGRDGHGRLARDHILREFTWERATRRLIEILSEFEEGRRPRLPLRKRRSLPAASES